MAASRSCYCGEPRVADIGKDLTLKGWLHHRRDHGGLIFIDLRDRSGICQVALDPSTMDREQFEAAHGLRSEYVLAVPPGTQSGAVVRLRGKGVPALNGRGRGDQLVVMRVHTPTRLNDEQRRLLSELAELDGGEIDEPGLFDRVKSIFS